MASANPLPNAGCSRRRKRNQTATSDFGHSRARVPETPRIAAYPRVSEIGAFRRASAKPLQVATFAERGVWSPA